MTYFPYWITFTNGNHACCEGIDSADAAQRAAKITFQDVTDVQILPYPAQPLLWQYTEGDSSPCPPFCWNPHTCQGHTSCPRIYACSE